MEKIYVVIEDHEKTEFGKHNAAHSITCVDQGGRKLKKTVNSIILNLHP